MSFSVFTVAWPNETVLQSKLRGPLFCTSGFLLWADHIGISLPLPSLLAGNDLLNSLDKHRSDVPPHQSGVFRVRFWASQFLFLCEPQHYIIAFWTQTQGSLRYSSQALNISICKTNKGQNSMSFLNPKIWRITWRELKHKKCYKYNFFHAQFEKRNSWKIAVGNNFIDFFLFFAFIPLGEPQRK